MMLKGLTNRWRPDREPLPSLFERHPTALAGSRHPRGLTVVPLSKIVGTARNPSQNTMDFLPLPPLRGRNWQSRWQRITAAVERLEILPPVELLQVGDEYWVVDGHNRIAAALQSGAGDVDADVTELLAPATSGETHERPSTAVVGSVELRQAGEGRFSPTTELRRPGRSREELARSVEAREIAEADPADAAVSEAAAPEVAQPEAAQPEAEA